MYRYLFYTAQKLSLFFLLCNSLDSSSEEEDEDNYSEEARKRRKDQLIHSLATAMDPDNYNPIPLVAIETRFASSYFACKNTSCFKEQGPIDLSFIGFKVCWSTLLHFYLAYLKVFG